jgi:hypothetical protein
MAEGRRARRPTDGMVGGLEFDDFGRFAVSRLVDVRARGGGISVLVEWEGHDENGEPWPMEWKAGGDLTMDLCRSAYEMLEGRIRLPAASEPVAVRASDRLSRWSGNSGSILTIDGDYVEEITEVVVVKPQHGPCATPRCDGWLVSKLSAEVRLSRGAFCLGR